MMDVEGDRFPVGLRVLVVDDNLPCLMILEKLLIKCNYHVTITSQATMALKMLREKKDRFDIIISDVHMPEMDGLKLLELIGHELDIPVLMVSTNDDPELVMKGVRHGAVDYLLKPVRIEELKNIWQHVVRKKKCSPNESDSEAKEDKTVQPSADNGNSHPTSQKPRVVWTTELHKKFVNIVDQLGLDKAIPKKILDLMNVEGLTVENVAIHLQRYKHYMKRMSSESSQQADPTATPFGALGSSIYLNGGSMLNPCGNGLLPNQNAGFPRLMDIDHFQHQRSLGAVPPDVKSQVTVPILQDYTKYMENWQADNGSRSTAYQHQMNCNQLPCSSFLTGFSSADVSQIQGAFKRSFTDGSANLSSPNGDLKGSQGSFISYNYIDVFLFLMFYFIVVIYYFFIM